MTQKHQWIQIGPVDEGGTVFSLCVAPSETKDTLWATTGTTLFRSIDGGDSWHPVGKGLRGLQLVTVAYGPPGVLIAGDLGGLITRSLDGGLEWSQRDFPGRALPITCLSVSPKFEEDSVVLLGTDGDGAWRSRDNGRHWDDVNFGLWDLNVLAIACAPDWTQREYAFVGTTDGVYRSTNGGRAWKPANSGLEGIAVSALAISPGFLKDHSLYAGTEEQGVYLSTDMGESWTNVSEGLSDLGINALWISPHFPDDGVLVAGTSSGISRSDDGGQHWTPVAEGIPPVLCLTGSANGVYAGLVNAGVLRSLDQGKSWSPATQGLAARNYARLIPCPSGTLLALGSEEGLVRSNDGGESWEQVPVPEEYLPLTTVEAIAGSGGQTWFLAGSYEGGLIHSEDDGQTWRQVDGTPHIRAIVISPDFQRDQLAWAGTDEGQLLVSSEGGEIWASKSTPFEGEQVVRLAASPHFSENGTLFAGTFKPAGEGPGGTIHLWRSDNQGERWHLYLEQESQNPWLSMTLPPAPGSRPYNAGVFGIGSRIFRPSGSPGTQETISPEEPAIVALIDVPRGEKEYDLYAATSQGVFLSRNRGKSWESFSKGLPDGPILSLVPSPDYLKDGLLYALSLGGTLWCCEVN
ncbi:MAG: hypothetical protein L6435_15055 [Anaerolineae bacterium]|nr:hypothetical protein [Anaerolineae bacterium]